jgi:hypothetical protein
MSAMKIRATRAGGPGLALVLAAVACGPSPMMAGVLTSSGGELGDFEFAPDSCDYKPDLQAIDMFDSTKPGITLRVVRPESSDPVVVLANTRAPGGPREVSMSVAATCTVHKGYHAVLYGDRGVGVRIECTTPEGGHVWGTAGAGVCK